MMLPSYMINHGRDRVEQMMRDEERKTDPLARAKSDHDEELLDVLENVNKWFTHTHTEQLTEGFTQRFWDVIKAQRERVERQREEQNV